MPSATGGVELIRFEDLYGRGRHRIEGLDVQDHVQRIGEQLFPLLDRCNRMVLRNLKALRELRQGPILVPMLSSGRLTPSTPKLRLARPPVVRDERNTMATSPPPVHVTLDLAEAGADMHRLLVLDAAWTGAAERSGECTDRDREALVGLGNQIDTQFALVERHAATLRHICESYREWVNERVSSALTGERFTPSQRDDIRRMLGAKDGDYAARGVAFADSLARRVPVEREELRRKMRPLRGNSPVVTDMSDETACFLAGAGAVVSLAWGAFGLHMAVTYVLAAQETGCF